MNKILKKLMMMTPILLLAALVAGFLPDVLTLASSKDKLSVIPEQTITQTSDVVRSAGSEAAVAAKTRLSREQVREIALARYNGTITELELDDSKWYEVEILFDGKEFELKIDAYTGDVLRVESKKVTATKPAVSIANDKTEAAAKQRITREEARQIALAKVNGTIVEMELDDHRYEVEIRADGKEYDLEINIYTGQIEKFTESKMVVQKASAPAKPQVTETRSRITRDEARKIALNRISGTVTELELDDNHYEVEIQANGNEYDITINAYTGKIIEVDVDRITYDDDNDGDDHDDDDDDHDDDDDDRQDD